MKCIELENQPVNRRLGLIDDKFLTYRIVSIILIRGVKYMKTEYKLLQNLNFLLLESNHR